MNSVIRVLTAAGALLLLSGCANVEIQFTRAERINLSEEKSAGRPLEIAIVAITRDDFVDRRIPESITSYDWFKAADAPGGGAPFGLPSDQIWYYANSTKPYGTKVGDALEGYAKAETAIPPAKFDYPRQSGADKSAIYVFARYQDAQNGLRGTAPIISRKIIFRSNPTRIYVGPSELRLDK